MLRCVGVGGGRQRMGTGVRTRAQRAWAAGMGRAVCKPRGLKVKWLPASHAQGGAGRVGVPPLVAGTHGRVALPAAAAVAAAGGLVGKVPPRVQLLSRSAG